MSSRAKQSNLEILREGYDAFGRGAIDEVLAVMDDDIEWIEAEGGPFGGVWRGPEAVLENVFQPIGEEWDEFHVEPERFVDGGETVVALGSYRGTYSKTGKSFETPFAHVFDMNDGKIVRFQQYVDTVVHNEPLSE